MIRGKRGDLVQYSRGGYHGIILAVEKDKTIVFTGNGVRMVCEPGDLQIVPIITGAGENNPSNFYELLPVHYDDAPHDFRIKQVEQDREIERCFKELEKTRLAFRLLVDELAESKKIGDEVLARLREGCAAREKQT